MLRKSSILAIIAVSCTGIFPVTQAAQISNDINLQWKTEQEVRDLYGEPLSIRGPIGTHASYQLWQYSDFSIAFVNKRVNQRIFNEEEPKENNLTAAKENLEKK